MRKLDKYEAVTLILCKLSNEVDMTDMEALSMSEYFPVWENILGLHARYGFKFLFDGKLYEVKENYPEDIFIEAMKPSKSTLAFYRYIPNIETEQKTEAPNKYERISQLEQELKATKILLGVEV